NRGTILPRIAARYVLHPLPCPASAGPLFPLPPSLSFCWALANFHQRVRVLQRVSAQQKGTRNTKEVPMSIAAIARSNRAMRRAQIAYDGREPPEDYDWTDSSDRSEEHTSELQSR